MRITFYNIGSVLIFVFMTFCVYGQQGNTEVFGKNRVQYHDDFRSWTHYESQNFITYWYGKSRNTGIAAMQIAEYDHNEIRSLLEHRMNEKIELIVYSDLTDLHQTNIGNNELFESKPGETTIIGSKLFLYFDGRHDHLRDQVRMGVARVYLYQMLLGSNWQQFFSYLTQMEYPDWYLKGIVRYVALGWDLESDDRLRSIVLSEEYDDFYELANDEPALAGQMFWYYITQKFGNSVMANVLYSNRVNKSIDNAFLYIVGRDLETLMEETWNNYQLIYNQEAKLFPQVEDSLLIKFKNKYKSRISQVAYHPDGNHITFVENELGQWKLYLFNLDTEKKERLMKLGQENPFQKTDYNYPLIKWSDDGEELFIIYEKKDIIRLRILDREGEILYDKSIVPSIRRIYNFDIVDEKRLILSFSLKSFSDLGIYNYKTRNISSLNSDYYDDLDVAYGSWQGRKGVYFTSNRDGKLLRNTTRDTIIPVGAYDIYFLAEENWGDLNIRADRITRSYDSNEMQLKYIDGSLYYQHEAYGKYSIKKFKIKAEDGVVGDFLSNVLRYDISPVNASEGIYVMRKGLKERLYRVPINEDEVALKTNSTLVKPQEKLFVEEGVEEVNESFEISEDAPKFQSRFPDPEKLPFGSPKEEENVETDIGILLPKFTEEAQTKTENGNLIGVGFDRVRAIASRLRFKYTGLNVDFSNEPLYDGLNSYAGEKPGYSYAPFGLLINTRIYDLFEDYEFNGGARFPLRFNGSEYYLTFSDKKNRWDKIYGFYRKAERHSVQSRVENKQTREVSTIGTYEMRYPFDAYRSLRLRATLRFDSEIRLAIDRPSLETDPIKTQRLGLRAEYVYDDTYDLMYNMKVGSRYKVYIEGVNRFQVQVNPWNFSASDAFMTLIGLDARHYIRLDRFMILAGRVAGSTSFGSEQILYYMGGVDNWLFPKFSDGIAIPPDGNFVYNGIASPIRGFEQNVRNGSSYVLGNLEFRVSPLNYLSKRQLKSTFLKNFMLVGFLDVGTAWYGTSPYSDENPLNTSTIMTQPDPPKITGNITYYRDPLILGYGAGVRVHLYGFYARFDYAKGIDTKETNDGIFYFSLGKDF